MVSQNPIGLQKKKKVNGEQDLYLAFSRLKERFLLLCMSTFTQHSPLVRLFILLRDTSK